MGIYDIKYFVKVYWINTLIQLVKKKKQQGRGHNTQKQKLNTQQTSQKQQQRSEDME